MTALLVMAAALTFASVAILLIVREVQVHVLNVRVAKAVTGTGQSAPMRDMVEWLSSLGKRYRRFYSAENLEQLRLVVQTAGFNPHRTMPILIGTKTVSMFAFPLFGLFAAEFSGGSSRNLLIYTLVGAIIGIMGPRFVMSRMRKRFNASVQRGTPDMIDLLVVCSEAGMGLEGALERVSQEMVRSNSAMSRVLNGLLDDLRVLPDRHEAFDNLSKRSLADGLIRFGTMIDQSLQYGTPLSHALRAIAEELRRDRLIKLEERAHKLGAKLILPMALFMLPAMFVVLGGSSILHLMQLLTQL
jgi:tight adherence protein C